MAPQLRRAAVLAKCLAILLLFCIHSAIAQQTSGWQTFYANQITNYDSPSNPRLLHLAVFSSKSRLDLQFGILPDRKSSIFIPHRAKIEAGMRAAEQLIAQGVGILPTAVTGAGDILFSDLKNCQSYIWDGQRLTSFKVNSSASDCIEAVGLNNVGELLVRRTATNPWQFGVYSPVSGTISFIDTESTRNRKAMNVYAFNDVGELAGYVRCPFQSGSVIGSCGDQPAVWKRLPDGTWQERFASPFLWGSAGSINNAGQVLVSQYLINPGGHSVWDLRTGEMHPIQAEIYPPVPATAFNPVISDSFFITERGDLVTQLRYVVDQTTETMRVVYHRSLAVTPTPLPTMTPTSRPSASATPTFPTAPVPTKGATALATIAPPPTPTNNSETSGIPTPMPTSQAVSSATPTQEVTEIGPPSRVPKAEISGPTTVRATCNSEVDAAYRLIVIPSSGVSKYSWKLLGQAKGLSFSQRRLSGTFAGRERTRLKLQVSDSFGAIVAELPVLIRPRDPRLCDRKRVAN